MSKWVTCHFSKNGFYEVGAEVRSEWVTGEGGEAVSVDNSLKNLV